MKTFGVLVLAFALVAVSGGAGEYEYYTSGQALQAELSDKNDHGHYMRGMGYVSGVHDALSMLGLLCGPSNAKQGQLAQMVQKHLDENPGELHKAGAVQVAQTFWAAEWECPGGVDRLRDSLINFTAPEVVR